MKEILTQRTRIVPYNEAHIPDILKMFAEPDSNKFIQPLLGKNETYYRKRLLENAELNKSELQYFTVFTRDTNEFVGTMNLNKFSLTGHDQIGLHFSRKFWHQGYGKETCQALLEYARDIKGLSEIYWVFEKDHEVSKKLAQSLGFKPSTTTSDGDIELEIYHKRLK